MKTKKEQTFKQIVMLSERNWKNLRTLSRHVSKIIRTPLQKTQEKIIVSAIQYSFYDYDDMTPAERKQLGDEARALLREAKQDKRTTKIVQVGPYTYGRLLDLSNQGGEDALIALSCLSWKWRKRSSVKIAERTYEKGKKALHRRQTECGLRNFVVCRGEATAAVLSPYLAHPVAYAVAISASFFTNLFLFGHHCGAVG